MTTTTHVATACLITVFTIQSGMGSVAQVLTVAAASFVSHLLLDVLPHGFIADPDTIFKKAVPTLLELGPGPVILVFSIFSFGHSIQFLLASGVSIMPDVVTTLMWNHSKLASRIPGFPLIHRLHRLVHWFETDNPDGTVSYLFPNRPFLIIEFFITVCLLSWLYALGVVK